MTTRVELLDRWAERDLRYTLRRSALAPEEIEAVRSWRRGEALEANAPELVAAVDAWWPPKRLAGRTP